MTIAYTHVDSCDDTIENIKSNMKTVHDTILNNNTYANNKNTHNNNTDHHNKNMITYDTNTKPIANTRNKNGPTHKAVVNTTTITTIENNTNTCAMSTITSINKNI